MKRKGLAVELKRSHICDLENVAESKAYRILMEIAAANGMYRQGPDGTDKYPVFRKTRQRIPDTKKVTIKMYADYRGLTIAEVIKIYKHNTGT